MAQRNVRRIAVESRPAPDETWDSGWLPPVARRVRQWALAESPRLALWGGWAGIVGAVLWSGIFLYLQFLLPSHWWDWFFLPEPATQFLAVPIILFMLCLSGLFVRQEKHERRSAGLSRVGFVMACLGLIFTAVSTIDAYWFGLFDGARPDGLIDFVYYGPIVDWDEATSGGLVLAGAGMVLSGIAGVRARALPVWSAVWFVGAPSVSFLVHVGFALSVNPSADAFSQGRLLYGSGVFVGLMLLFGIAWAVAGYQLLRSRTSTTGSGA
jgi:hypothetical protein